MTMPRTLAEILRHADQLSARFEDYEPDSADEFDREVVALLRAAVQERSDAERHVLDAIRAARQAGMSWSAIGLFVGTSGEAARQRYSRLTYRPGPWRRRARKCDPGANSSAIPGRTQTSCSAARRREEP